MANLFGGSKSVAKQPTRAMGIDLQGSQYGHAIPVLYGRNKIAGNCIWYGDFKAVKHQQKVGKGGGGATSTSYTYKASYQFGLTEGPIIGIPNAWVGTSTKTLTGTIALGTAGQSPWAHLTGGFALGYSGTALYSISNDNLGSSPSLPNINFEIDGLQQFDHAGGIYDANGGDILNDVCTSTAHGIGFSYLGDLTQYKNYCTATGLFLSPVYSQQQAAGQVLGDLFNWTNSAAYFSEKQLKVVPLGDQAVTGNGVTYTPNVTPVVDLGLDDFLVENKGDDPVQIDRKSPTDASNIIRLEFNDRSQSYHTSSVVAQIDEDVIANGSRADESVQVDACTEGSVARFIAQNMLQRKFFIRNTYTFRLGWRYCYLEPTDIVTLTEPGVGLATYPVRITEVEEDEYGTLTFTAEEFPEGIGHAASYAYTDPSGTLIDTNVDPGAVNSPFLFRGPGFLVNGSNPEIWCAVNGSGAYWAGCQVYISYDGTTYQYLGQYTGGARYGLMTTALGSGSDPDTVHTPTVVLNAPGTLLGGSVTDADNFNTMALVDSELISYETATLTGANTYQLGYLRRGGYGTAIASHAVNAPFARLDEDIIRIPVDPSQIGTTVHLKFLSINSFGNTPRDLSGETPYTYVIGTNVEFPDVPAVPQSPSAVSVADGVSITWTNSNPAAIGATSIEVSTTGTGGWTVLDQVARTASGYVHRFTSGATYYYRLRARGFLVQSGWSAYTAVISNKGKTSEDGSTAGATSGPGGNLNGEVDANHRPAIDFSFGSHVNPKLMYLQDDTLYRKTGVGYVDSSNRISGVWDSGVGTLRSGSAIGTGVSRATSAIDSGNVVVAGSIDMSRSYTGKHLGNIPDDPTSTRYAAAEAGATNGYNKGQNIVTNPCGAAGFSGWPSWIGGSQQGMQTTVETNGPSFACSLGTSLDQGVTQNIPCAAGGIAMILSAQMYSAHMTSGTHIIQLRFLNSSKAEINSSNRPAITSNNATGSFARYSQTFTPDAGTAYIQVIMRSTGTGPAGALSRWSQIKIEVGSAVTPFTVTNSVGDQLGNSGSGYQIGDPQNLNPSVAANYVSNWSGQTISYSSTSTTATISVSAANLNLSGVSKSYGSMSVGVTGSGTVTYFLYVDDPTYAGGSLTLHATTNADTLLANTGRIQVGTITVTYGSSGSGGGSGGCPVVDAYVLRAFEDGRANEVIRAGDIEVGMLLALSDGTRERVTFARIEKQPCVRVVGQSGYSLTCSESAELELAGGGFVLAKDAAGHTLRWKCPVPALAEEIVRVEPVGTMDVMHATLLNRPNDFYLTGDHPDCLFSHHNMKPGSP